jgi:hypothetical protein
LAVVQVALRRVWEVTYKKSIAHKSALNMLKMQISTQESQKQTDQHKQTGEGVHMVTTKHDNTRAGGRVRPPQQSATDNDQAQTCSSRLVQMEGFKVLYMSALDEVAHRMKTFDERRVAAVKALLALARAIAHA